MQKVTVNNHGLFEVVRKGEQYLVDGKEIAWDVSRLGENRFHIIKDNKSFNVEVLEHESGNKNLVIRINGNIYNVNAKDHYDMLLEALGIDLEADKKAGDMRAPMPGLVLDVLVTSGQAIKKGDPLLVLEAMKMENILKATGDGTVSNVLVAKGAKVEKNAVLLNFE